MLLLFLFFSIFIPANHFFELFLVCMPRVPFFFPSLLINVFLLAFDFPSRSTPPILFTPMSQKMGLT